MSLQYTPYTPTRSEIPETHIYKFTEIHTKEAAKIKANEYKDFAFNTIKGLVGKGMKLLNMNKKEEDIEISYDGCVYKSFWLADAHRITEYQTDINRQIPIDNIDATQISIHFNEQSSFTYEVNNSAINIKLTEICTRKNDYYNIIDNETGFIDNNLQKEYVDNKDYRKRKFKFDLDFDKIIKPQLSKTAVIQQINANLSTQVNATRITAEHIAYNKIDLYLIPIYIFKCYKQSTEETAYIRINALTGKIVKEQTKLGDILSQEEFKNLVLDVAAEVASTFVPGSGPALRYLAGS